ncbi:putative family hydrolase protein [Eutypa lata UCREL1]|uniref:Putative family hydrolase protein n=1 Tax=Eutypa lata (strain UCR-EL1) TaxID=1287681 RepID=M7TBB6_EUTLA|nr:putative family hydrolase protein [Eutypa lata UCREL1]
MSVYTKDLGPYYRGAVHPQEVLSPLQPAPHLKRETTTLEGGKVLFEKDIPIKVRDGTTLYADLYRPTSEEVKVPAIVLFAPFGKHGAVPKERFQNMDVDFTKLKSEDHAVASIEHPLLDEYWKSKIVNWGDIQVPAFSVTGWSSLGLHLRGTIEAWKGFSSQDKYLLIHGGREWSEFYKQENIEKQLRFWERYLKNVANDVDKWPKVQFDVRTSATESFRRALSDFPPAATHTRYLLNSGSELSSHTQGAQNPEFVTFQAHQHDSVVFFDYVFTRRTEISGFSSVKLYVQAMHFPDVDLFVALQKLDNQSREVRFYHSTQQLEASATFGWLRASHRELDEAKSTPERPVHLHRKRLWLQPRDVVEVNIELWPSSTMWNSGERLRLAIKGTTFTNPNNFTQFKGPSHSFGEVRVWYGGQYDSNLLVPVIP